MKLSIRLALWALSLLVAIPSSAGIRPFAFTFDTPILARGDVELEQWLWGKVKPPASKPSVGWLWLGAVYGLTSRVEVALPWEAVATPTETRITDFALDVRIRLDDPVDDPGEGRLVRMLVRAFYQLNFTHPLNGTLPNLPWLGANWITSFGDPKGSHGSIDVGIFGDSALGSPRMGYNTLGAGYSHKVFEEVQLGAEYYHEVSLGPLDGSARRYYLGPNAAFKRGHVWATFGALFGLNDQAAALLPRLILGVSL